MTLVQIDMIKEKKILKDIIDGDINALESIYNNYSELVLNHCYKILLDREAAEDLMHDIFVEMPKLLKSFKFNSSFSTWLYRIIHNKSLMKLRQQKNRLRIMVDNIIPFAKTYESPANNEKSNIGNSLNTALEQLDPTTRSMLWLKDAEELSIEELVDIFQQPAGTIKSKLSRARKKLKNIIERENNHD